MATGAAADGVGSCGGAPYPELPTPGMEGVAGLSIMGAGGRPLFIEDIAEPDVMKGAICV